MLKLLKKILFTVILSCVAFAAVFAGVVFIQKTYVYPLSDYREEIISSADRYGLSRALIFAVVKTESGFNASAKSDKGALGLMQITPDTADYIAKNRGIKDYDLKNAKTNLDFGCYYLKYLQNKFEIKDTYLSAYNAGEGNVFNWLKQKEYSPDGKSLTKIPFKETREYVNKINKSLTKYKNLYFNILDKS